MSSIRIKDKAFGKQKEITIKEIINNKFNCAIKKLPPFHVYDFIDKKTNTYFEHKGRRNEYNKYPTTMIGYNKIEFIKKNPNNIYYFIFGFTDGNYYIKYDEELFKTFNVNIGGRNDREKPEYKNYLYIPITALTNLCDVVVDQEHQL